MSVVARWVILVMMAITNGSAVFGYTRPLPSETLLIHPWDDAGSATPDQVHVSIVGNDGIRVSWMTEKRVPISVEYGTSPGNYELSSTNGSSTTYDYFLYKSHIINHVTIGPLQPNTVYYYRCGADQSRNFTLKTPPSHYPIKFAVVGDLGQTEDTKSTLEHIAASDYDLLLLPGDLSYADTYQPAWDSFGRMVEPLASRRPWMVTQGNHEVEKVFLLHPTPFTSYNSRWLMPYREAASNSNLYYSFDVAGGAVHVIMLGSYTDFEQGSEQYAWLQDDLGRVDRSRTHWVIALVHAPWYSTNKAHRGEYESVGMKAAMERLLYAARVDFVFAGHVHAYERFTSVYDGRADKCGPLHVILGDGGNSEGLATEYDDPQLEISLFREASFGHGELEVVNATHALWTWFRNQDDQGFISDSVWMTSVSSSHNC